MSTPWAQSATLTSSSQFSTPIQLDPLAKMTVVQITITSSGGLSGLLPAGAVAAFSVQASVDTPAFSAAGGIQPTPQPLFSAVGGSSGLFTINSTGSSFQGLSSVDGSAMFVLLQPIAALRLASSAAGSSLATVITLRALQSPAA